MDTLKLALLLFTVLNVMRLLMSQLGCAQLTQKYYANICPGVETIVRDAVAAKLQQQQLATIPGTLRLFFHDCFVQGCDASVLVASTPTNTAEKDHPDNLSLAGDGFDTVIKAKAAVDAVPRCTNKVSCADILAMAARDAVALAGGPNYAVELGRLDGLSSTAASVNGKLPEPSFRVGQLTAMFAAKGLSQEDMIALSAAHTVGVSQCNRFSDRIYNFKSGTPAPDPTLNETYSAQLQASCPRNNPEPDSVANLDPITPGTFDNQYFKNLQQRMGLLTSDQSLYEDSPSSRSTVDAWAQDSEAFNQAFVTAMTKLGRVGVKTGTNGNIRRDCGILN